MPPTTETSRHVTMSDPSQNSYRDSTIDGPNDHDPSSLSAASSRSSTSATFFNKIPDLISALRGSREALRASQQELRNLENQEEDAASCDGVDDDRRPSLVEREREKRLKEKMDGQAADANEKSGQDEEVEDEFKKKLKNSSKKIIEMLRTEADGIEDGIHKSETEVIRKSREAFQITQDDFTTQRLSELQAVEIVALNQAFKVEMEARKDRKMGKIAQRKIMRDTKARDLQIVTLDLANSRLDVVNQTLKFRRAEYDAKVEQLEGTHRKQLRQLGAAQERRLGWEKQLARMEMGSIKDEVIRQAIQKKSQMRATHQRAADKRITDQLLAYQAMELRQAKAKYELETIHFEMQQALVASNLKTVRGMQGSQIRDLNAEKERLLQVRELAKIKIMNVQHATKIKRIGHNHRLELRRLTSAQKKALRAALQAAGVVDSSNASTANHSNIQSNAQSANQSVLASPNKSRNISRSNSQDSVCTDSSFISTDTNTTQELQELNVDSDPEVQAIQLGIKALIESQRKARTDLRSANKDAMEKANKDAEEEMRVLMMAQRPELEQLAMGHQLEISTLKAFQEKEIAMEESVLDAEANALLERKTLNYVLNAVDDGIINMDQKGRITRVNMATEMMFDYQIEDLLGKDIRMLVPVECRKNGKGRRVTGKRRDGTTFPCHVAISEVTADGIHLFTGILRDVTQELAEAAHAKAVDAARAAELEAAKHQADDLLQRMFPSTVANQLLSGVPVAPENFDSATVFFSDVVGFTEIASRCSAIQMVDFLNDLYGTFDSIISQYDAYKVETIGDCYMVVSGVPKLNGDLHAGEIAKMALHLVSAVKDLRFKGQPDLRIQIRVGLSTGPVAAGVVGHKMPRYCLFGNTVNVASRMESTGLPMHIHVTESTYTALQRLGGYSLSLRGEIQVKGKGQMRTYFLTAKDGFDHVAPVTSQ